MRCISRLQCRVFCGVRRDVVGYEAVESVRAEGAQCKGKEEGDHAGCAQYVDARDEVKEEFVQGCVRTEGVGDGEYEEAEEKCDVDLFSHAREGKDGEEEGTMPTYSELILKALRPQYLWVVVCVSKPTNSGMTRANISSG